MKNEPIFSWDEATGFASCILTDGENTYYGHAQCAPDDLEFCSQKIGCEIAFYRARIAMYKNYRDTLRIKLNTLRNFYYTINQSQQFQPKGYETRMLNRQIRLIEDDIKTVKALLENEKNNLNDYLKIKAKLHEQLRRMRG